MYLSKSDYTCSIKHLKNDFQRHQRSCSYLSLSFLTFNDYGQLHFSKEGYTHFGRSCYVFVGYNPINIPLVHSQPKDKNKMMNSHCRGVAVISRIQCLLIERWSIKGMASFVKKDKRKSQIQCTCTAAWSQTVTVTMISQIEVNNALQQKNSVPLTKDYFHHYHAIKAQGLGL